MHLCGLQQSWRSSGQDLLLQDSYISSKGQLEDTDILAECLKETKAAFICIAAIANEPYCTISQDAARAVIAAMQKLRSAHPNRRLPRLIQLNSSSTDEKLSASLPKIAHAIIYRGDWWIYKDLEAAISFYRIRRAESSCNLDNHGALAQPS